MTEKRFSWVIRGVAVCDGIECGVVAFMKNPDKAAACGDFLREHDFEARITNVEPYEAS